MERRSPWRFSNVSQLSGRCAHAFSLVIGQYAESLGLRLRIPGKSKITKMIFDPPMGHNVRNLIWKEVFQFPSKYDHCESVVWRRFVPAGSCVHRIGCMRQHDLRLGGRSKTYAGSVTAQVREVRAYRNPNNHGFNVFHAPSEGIHHAHIQFAISPDNLLTRNDKNELKFALEKIFSVSSPHICGLQRL